MNTQFYLCDLKPDQMLNKVLQLLDVFLHYTAYIIPDSYTYKFQINIRKYQQNYKTTAVVKCQ